MSQVRAGRGAGGLRHRHLALPLTFRTHKEAEGPAALVNRDCAVPAVLRAGPYATALTEGQLTIRDDVTPACAGSGCTLKLHLTSPVRTPNLQPGSVPM